jgi:hypothetical protein
MTPWKGNTFWMAFIQNLKAHQSSRLQMFYWLANVQASCLSRKCGWYNLWLPVAHSNRVFLTWSFFFLDLFPWSQSMVWFLWNVCCLSLFSSWGNFKCRQWGPSGGLGLGDGACGCPQSLAVDLFVFFFTWISHRHHKPNSLTLSPSL